MKKNITTFSAVVLLALSMTPWAAATVRYVTPNGQGDGSSWAAATNDLQAAIEASSAGDEVWVAKGTYKPDSLIKSTKPTSKAFFLKDGVSLFGGFAGNETSKDARALKTTGKPFDFENETILSADDDVPDTWKRAIGDGTTYRNAWAVENDVIPGTAGNSCHVLFQLNAIVNATEINGFTLTGGNACEWKAKAAGGAVYALGNVAIKACRVIENSGYFKAQSINDSNTYGGAIYLAGSGDATISHCYFSSNYSHSSYGQGLGGAIYAKNVKIDNCEFFDCVGMDAGGAVFNENGTIDNCIFSNCYSASGGAVYNKGVASRLTISNCSGLLGGGCFNSGTLSHTKVFNCYADAVEFGETLGGQGGGVFSADGQVVGCVVYNNQSFRGGGIYLRGGKVVNSTVQNNMLRAESDTANIGLFMPQLAASVLNTIGNPDAAATNFVKPSTFKGVSLAGTPVELIEANWALAAGSEFIDKGTLTPGIDEATDMAGNARVMGSSIDVGAYEYAGTVTPTITLTYPKAGESVRIGVGGKTGYTFGIDWGDGTLQEYTKAGYFTETLKSNTVKIYGDSVMLLVATSQNLQNLDFGNAPVLSRIQVGNNQLQSLDVTGLAMLTGIYAEDNAITSLDVTGNKFLRVLDVHNNKIEGSIDCSAMTKLSKVDVANNKLTRFILPKQSVLGTVDCASNMLTDLDVTNLDALTELHCDSNMLSTLDLTGLTALEEVYAYGNQFTQFVTAPCPALKTLNASDNKISSVDLSSNIKLEGVYLYKNQLKSLDLTKNTDVRYINVGDNQLKGLNTSNQPNLSLIIANNNEISSVDFANNTRLTQVMLAHNQLNSIDVTKAGILSWFKVDNNNLSELNVQSNPYLYWLECDSNRIEKLDLSKNTYVQWIAAQNNLLKGLNLTANKGLQGLFLQNNMMEQDSINSIIEQLQDVSGVEIHANNEAWARQLNISYMPGTEGANVAAAQAKGWIVTALYETSGVDHVDGDNAVVKSVYYNLNGVELGQQVTEGGIYIVKEMHRNGSVTARKVLVVK